MNNHRQYRGLTKDGKWVYGMPVESVNDRVYMIHGATEDSINTRNEVDFIYSEVIPETVDQSTGLLDKNGVEIYAGDLVHIWSTFYKKDMPEAEVFWNEKAAKFDVKPSDGQYHHWLAMGHHKGWFVEVIGNIHQKGKK